jgi:hypothetical protein
MKGSVQDKTALDSLHPLEVAAYLRTSGWVQTRSSSGKEVVWTKDSGESLPFEARLPLDRQFGDFALRMHDLLAVLETTEERSQFEILRDLQTSATDVIRIRLLARESSDGTLQIDDGVDLVGHAREIMMASACSTARPRVWYRRRRPPEAEEYIRTVRLGQTEVGSYVISVLSRVAPSFTSHSVDEFARADPFERRVTTNLASFLDVMRVSAEVAASNGDMAAFKDKVDEGVSVNLCDAVAGLAPEDPRSHDGIRFEFMWSPGRPQVHSVPKTIVIPSDAIDVIKEAGRALRQYAPLEEVEVRGPVRRLERNESDPEGVATVVGLVDGQWRNIRVVLSDPDYTNAVRAHSDRIPVTCIGDVVREGRSLVMKTPTSFSVEDDELS